MIFLYRKAAFWLLLILLVMAGSACDSTHQESVSQEAEQQISEPGDRPNIVLLISDDHDESHYGFRGHPLVNTPNIDQLAHSGVVFDTAYSVAARCRPTLASIVTGLLPQQNYIFTNRGAEQYQINGDELPTVLARYGYKTFVGGKFWEYTRERFGFQDTRGWGVDFAKPSQQTVLDFIQQHASSAPMFIWWAPNLPHAPHEPPESILEKYNADDIPVPNHIRKQWKSKYQQAEKQFIGMVDWLDQGVGTLIKALEDAGQMENTLFVYFADNGFSHGYVSKGTPYEKGLVTPLIFSWQGGINGNKKLDSPVSLIDVYPTVLDFADIPIPDYVAGKSLKQDILSETQTSHQPLYGAVYPAFTRDGPNGTPEEHVYGFYERKDNWKTVVFVKEVTKEARPALMLGAKFSDHPNRKAGDIELYNLTQDPYEMNNLAADPQYTEQINHSLQAIQQWWINHDGKAVAVLDNLIAPK